MERARTSEHLNMRFLTYESSKPVLEIDANGWYWLLPTKEGIRARYQRAGFKTVELRDWDKDGKPLKDRVAVWVGEWTVPHSLGLHTPYSEREVVHHV